MSKEEDKIKHSTRLHKDDNAINKQVKIAKAHGLPLDKAHGFAKQHAMDCGNPECGLCGNRRKVFGEKTVQEEKFDKQYRADQRAKNNDADD